MASETRPCGLNSESKIERLPATDEQYGTMTTSPVICPTESPAPTESARRLRPVGRRVLRNRDGLGQYGVRLASSTSEVRDAQTLRFLVFNLELNEGLERSFVTCRDEDRFDAVCDHLIVEDRRTQEIVGTYRLQTGMKAGANWGYYSATEFDLDSYEPWRGQILELGRACVHSQHRNLAVLGLLWQGIVRYARLHGARYLMGCSSIPSVDPAVGTALYLEMPERNRAASEWQTQPRAEYRCPPTLGAPAGQRFPKLLAAYLSLGARICSPPALDREFKTIDFLTWMDIESLPDSASSRAERLDLANP